jgi:hypothetical protein
MPRDKGDALSVKMEFEQIRRAKSGTTTVSIIGGGTVNGIAKKPTATSVPALSSETKAGTTTVEATNEKKLKDKFKTLFNATDPLSLLQSF